MNAKQITELQRAVLLFAGLNPSSYFPIRETHSFVPPETVLRIQGEVTGKINAAIDYMAAMLVSSSIYPILIDKLDKNNKDCSAFIDIVKQDPLVDLDYIRRSIITRDDVFVDFSFLSTQTGRARIQAEYPYYDHIVLSKDLKYVEIRAKVMEIILPMVTDKGNRRKESGSLYAPHLHAFLKASLPIAERINYLLDAFSRVLVYTSEYKFQIDAWKKDDLLKLFEGKG